MVSRLFAVEGAGISIQERAVVVEKARSMGHVPRYIAMLIGQQADVSVLEQHRLGSPLELSWLELSEELLLEPVLPCRQGPSL
ncbi:MAG TPA: hypothetical protein VND68_04530 [Chloroflexia bacterium]|jgi:hypothetical protein|nr:hypothetical protein [Chloroflexia bacterium]